MSAWSNCSGPVALEHCPGVRSTLASILEAAAFTHFTLLLAEQQLYDIIEETDLILWPHPRLDSRAVLKESCG